MAPPSTSHFVIRHYGVYFFLGIILALLCLYLLLTYTPDPPDLASRGIATGISIGGRPMFALGLMVGLGMAFWAWCKGDETRDPKQ